MKKIYLMLLALGLAGSSVFAQMPPESKPDLELTKEEANFRIEDFQSKVNSLDAKLNELNNKVTDLNNQINSQKKSLQDCKEELKRLLNVTDADIDAFRQKLGYIEGKIREFKGMSDDQLAEKTDQIKALENELNQLRANKLSCMPEFYNKIIALAKDIKGLYREKKINSYTVGTWAEDKDCLWNIAGKIEIYGDPFQWPKIWQANTDIIRNPDIIFPGQVLKVPVKGPKTPEEIKAERKYWRKKNAAKEAAAAEVKTEAPAATKGN